jgi:hypothetical protein
MIAALPEMGLVGSGRRCKLPRDYLTNDEHAAVISLNHKVMLLTRNTAAEQPFVVSVTLLG